DGAAIAGDRRVELASILEEIAAIRMRFGVLRLEIDRLSVERRGLRQPILPGEEEAEIVVRLGIAWIELDGRLVTASGFVVAPEPIEDLAEVVAANRRVGPQSDRALNERESRSQVPALHRDHAEQMQRIGVLRLAPQYLAIAALRVGETAGSMVL